MNFEDIIKDESNKDKSKIKVNGERIRPELDPEIKNQELLGIQEKIALQAFKDNPEAEEATVTYNGRQRKHYRQDFKEGVFSDKDIL